MLLLLLVWLGSEWNSELKLAKAGGEREKLLGDTTIDY